MQYESGIYLNYRRKIPEFSMSGGEGNARKRFVEVLSSPKFDAEAGTVFHVLRGTFYIKYYA